MTDDTPREDPPCRLRWGMSVARNASRFGAENTILVFDGDDHIGDIELSDANAATLGTMLMDAATDENGDVITVDIAVDTSGFAPSPVYLPRLVDDCNSETYDKAKARLAYLEDWRVRQQQENGRLLGRLDSAQTELDRVRAEAVKILADREFQRSRRDHLIVGIRTLIDGEHTDAEGILLLLKGLIGTHKDRLHESSCPEHTGYKTCHCDCPDCRPDGVCACGHCRGWHRGHAHNAPEPK